MIENPFKRNSRFTAQDLENARKNFKDAEAALNAIDFDALDFDINEAIRLKATWKEARDIYDRIESSLRSENDKDNK